MGKGATLAIEIRQAIGEPVFLAVARALVDEIERGRLRPGDALPGTRSLSRSLLVNRNTIDAAYHELLMQGWLVVEPSKGTFVARDLPRPGWRSPPRTVADRTVGVRPIVSFSDGVADPRLAPTVSLGRAFRRAMTTPGFLTARGYGDPRGEPALREALSLYLKDERGLIAEPDRLVVTRGSQMALFLAASVATGPGTAIAVETPGYPLAWAAFREAGARVVGVPVDEDGVDVDALERVVTGDGDVRAVYVTPHHQYPTTVTLGGVRRSRLLDLARRHRLTIIEDDYDHEYRFDGPPVLPLAARDEAGVSVIYVGSLSKMIAPGIRLGYVTGTSTLVRRMAARREAIDRQGDQPLEQAVSDLLADGTMRRHLRKARRVYQARRDHVAALLVEHLSDVAEFTLPAGGLAIWLRLRSDISAEIWAADAKRVGLAVLPGVCFALDVAHRTQAFRIGFATLDEEEMSAACELLVRSRPR